MTHSNLSWCLDWQRLCVIVIIMCHHCAVQWAINGCSFICRVVERRWEIFRHTSPGLSCCKWACIPKVKGAIQALGTGNPCNVIALLFWGCLYEINFYSFVFLPFFPLSWKRGFQICLYLILPCVQHLYRRPNGRKSSNLWMHPMENVLYWTWGMVITQSGNVLLLCFFN